MGLVDGAGLPIVAHSALRVMSKRRRQAVAWIIARSAGTPWLKAMRGTPGTL